jgi:hypothetical protein
MAKFYGKIGFVTMEETLPDVWEPTETPKDYFGDLVRNQRRWSNGESVNENLDISNEISILLDDFLQENYGAIKWVEVMGQKWKVNSITLEYPRIRLTLGGVYNGG